eukprot:2784784-Amphidinium_carterae.2
MEEEDEVWALHGLTLADIVWLQSGVEARVCQCVMLHNKRTKTMSLQVPTAKQTGRSRRTHRKPWEEANPQ